MRFEPAIPLLGLYPENPETPIQKNLCTPVFIAAQFKIAKYWEHPTCLSALRDQKSIVHLHKGILCSREEEGTYTLCNSINGTGEPYAK